MFSAQPRPALIDRCSRGWLATTAQRVAAAEAGVHGDRRGVAPLALGRPLAAGVATASPLAICQGIQQLAVRGWVASASRRPPAAGGGRGRGGLPEIPPFCDVARAAAAGLWRACRGGPGAPRTARSGGGGLRFAGVSDIGRVRDTNEDSYCLVEMGPGGGVWLLAVADGLGGYRAGEVASRIAVQTLRERVWTEDGDWPASLRSAIREAHGRISAASAAEGELAGMGTTLTAVVIEGRHLYWGHVGDSRAYLLQGGLLRLLTRDHSVAGELLAYGQIGEDAARRHPQRNLLTQALGIPGELTVETGVSEVGDGDWLILTTDGLTEVVRGEEIAGAAASDPEPEDLCARLVALANERGGPDNITVLAARA